MHGQSMYGIHDSESGVADFLSFNMTPELARSNTTRQYPLAAILSIKYGQKTPMAAILGF